MLFCSRETLFVLYAAYIQPGSRTSYYFTRISYQHCSTYLFKTPYTYSKCFKYSLFILIFIMETGKILFMTGFLILGVLFGSTAGYSIGKASGVVEATAKLGEEQLAKQIAASEQTASAYQEIETDPLAGVTLNPFE